ncbi:hypothetical protein PT7_P069 (plasmid) [Pusillimonas sp. T7-7]|uniref:hypothetical protein n=1 Tax=Pusillimonas sp. (strain T7-7) TaxID=1007105 RepID=UPI0002084BD2|nr:hypothetical protein [Pusillimonas sp. T7-7]AEC22305.1 hypothetical protein PT7_P069 [Pusillimonas sp. T7-7]
MIPAELQFNCTHSPYYQKGCIACNARYVIFLRPSREKQDKFLSGLSDRDRAQTLEILKGQKDAA